MVMQYQIQGVIAGLKKLKCTHVTGWTTDYYEKVKTLIQFKCADWVAVAIAILHVLEDNGCSGRLHDYSYSNEDRVYTVTIEVKDLPEAKPVEFRPTRLFPEDTMGV
jgi:hypothetical protein